MTPDSTSEGPAEGVTRFAAWKAPLVAGLLFGALALVRADRHTELDTAAWIAGHIVVGASIGLLVSLCDGPGPGTLLSRFLALISVVTALIPIIGLPFNIAAYVMNRHHPGFHRTLSRVTLVTGVLMSLAGLGLLIRQS
jgi:hypothetical protein